MHLFYLCSKKTLLIVKQIFILWTFYQHFIDSNILLLIKQKIFFSYNFNSTANQLKITQHVKEIKDKMHSKQLARRKYVFSLHNKEWQTKVMAMMYLVQFQLF